MNYLYSPVNQDTVMRKGLLVILYWSLLITVGYGQDATNFENPRTKLEVFAGQGGTTIIEGFTEIGSINALVSGQLTIQASEFINPTANTKAYGIVITLKSSNVSTSYIDYDEIDSIVAALDFLAKTDKSVTKLDNVNATFQTRGGLLFHMYTRDNGNVNLIISKGRASAFNFRKNDLAQIRTFLVKAKEKLDNVK